MPQVSNIYKRTLPLLSNATFYSLVANANSPDGIATVTAYLLDALSYSNAPKKMLSNHNNAFVNFLSWCGQPDVKEDLPLALLNAIATCHAKAKAQISKKQWLVYQTGLDWKSAKQQQRRDLLLSQMQTHSKVVVHQLPEAYPPAGHWVAESASVHAKWYAHLKSGKLHDKHTRRCPIHLLDYTRLQRDIGPLENAYIVDETGVYLTGPVWLCALYAQY